MNDIASNEYTSIFTMIIIMVIMLAVVCIVVYYLVKKNVAKATQRATNVNNIMQQAIARSNSIVVGYRLEDERFYNIHGNMLPHDAMTLDEVLGEV